MSLVNIPSAILGMVMYTIMGLVATVFPIGIFLLVVLLASGVVLQLLKVDNYRRKIWRVAGVLVVCWIAYIWISGHGRSPM